MKEHVKRGKELNNTGMTLVEVLLAIFIISAISVPLMYCFVQVARTSAKGRELQQTTVVAQTIMENCKAYNLNNIGYMFDGYDPENPSVQPHNFLEGDYADYCGYKYVKPEAAGNLSHHFYITNLEIDNKKYGVHMKLTPTVTRTVDKYENINSRRDGVFTAQNTEVLDEHGNSTNMEDLEETVFLKFAQEIAQEVTNSTSGLVSLNATDVLTALYVDSTDPVNNPNPNYNKLWATRKIIVDAETTPDGDKATVKYEYTFKLTDGTESDKYYVRIPGDTSDTDITVTEKTYEYSVVIYTNEVTQLAFLDGAAPMQLERIYLFYVPAYKNYVQYPYKGDEEIWINNNLASGRNLDFYLVKQWKDGMDAGNLGNAETTYNVLLKGTGISQVNLYHNLKTNLGNPDTGTTMWQDANNTINVCGVTSETFMESESKDMMYKVELDMYLKPDFDAPDDYDTEADKDAAMSGTKVLTLDGTKINW